MNDLIVAALVSDHLKAIGVMLAIILVVGLFIFVLAKWPVMFLVLGAACVVSMLYGISLMIVRIHFR